MQSGRFIKRGWKNVSEVKGEVVSREERKRLKKLKRGGKGNLVWENKRY